MARIQVQDETLLPRSRHWFGHIGLRALARDEAKLLNRQRRRKLRPEEVAELRGIHHVRRELYALGRARTWADEHGAMHPLNVVRRQMNELRAEGLSYRCLNLEDLHAIRVGWPEWEPGTDIDLSIAPVSERTPEQGDGSTENSVEGLPPEALGSSLAPHPSV